MDSKEFVRLQAVAQRCMVERGEVMAGIMVTPKRGLPGGCFWCGRATSVLLFGRLRYESKKAFGRRAIDTDTTREVATDHKPCKACKEIMGRGICLKEATGDEGDAKPTGRYWVVTESCFRKIVKREALADAIVAKRRNWISEADAHQVGLYDTEAAA